MSRATLCRSPYSDISSRTMLSSSLNKNSASALLNSVLPTPVGPRKMKLPKGRLGSLRPARARRMVSATASTASSCPMTRRCSSASIRSSRSASPASSRPAGMPVHRDTSSAMSFSDTASSGPAAGAASRSAASFASRRSRSVRCCAAFS